MNGNVTTSTNNSQVTTGSKKRKRGLTPRKSTTASVTTSSRTEETGNSLSSTDLVDRSGITTVSGHLHNGQHRISAQNGEQTKTVKANRRCTLCGRAESNVYVDLRENVVMKQTLISSVKLPVHKLDTRLKSVCMQCICKINAHKDLSRSITLRLHRLTNGNAHLATDLNVHNGMEKSPEKKEMVQTLEEQKLKLEKYGMRLLTNTIETSQYSYPPEFSNRFKKKETPRVREVATAPANSASASGSMSCTKATTTTPAEPESKSTSTPPGIMVPSIILRRCDSMLRRRPNTPTSREKYVVRVEDITPEKSSPPIAPSPASCEARTEAELPKKSKPSNSPRDHNSMLQVFSEQAENVFLTESGGAIGQHNGNSSRFPTPLLCRHCPRVYRRKDYYAKHVRRCHARHRYALYARRAKSVVDAPISGAAPTNEQSEDIDAGADSSFVKLQREFHCSECPVTVENIVKLREHRRTHFKRYFCPTCNREFTTMYEYEFHCIECEAKQKVLFYSNQESSRNDDAYTSVRITRSRTRAATQAASVATATSWGTIRRARNRARTVGTYAKYSDNDSEDYSDDDDDVSVADTMYTKRMHFTGNWVEDHSETNSRTSMDDDNQAWDYDEDLQISSYKEYDLYLLDRLKTEFHLKSFTCFAADCFYRSPNIVFMMRHHYVTHWSNGWFYCKKCNRYFTSKVYLDYHLDRQNGGRFICYKCGDIFEFQHQLDRHLIRHTKSINYFCNYCNFEFLTEVELIQHCEIEQHSPCEERKRIGIEPAMTIINPMPAVMASNRANTPYRVSVIEMHLPPLPSKRAMELPRYKPSQRRIGDVEFKNQKNPNCYGWK